MGGAAKATPARAETPRATRLSQVIEKALSRNRQRWELACEGPHNRRRYLDPCWECVRCLKTSAEFAELSADEAADLLAEHDPNVWDRFPQETSCCIVDMESRGALVAGRCGMASEFRASGTRSTFALPSMSLWAYPRKKDGRLW